MLRRSVGKILMGLGMAMLVTAGVGALVLGTNGQGVAASPQVLEPTTTGPSDTTAASTEPASTVATPSATTTPAPTTSTTTTAPATTTTQAPDAAIAAFIGDFAAAISAQDTDWLLDHLHPAMILGYGEDVCRKFINDEILELKQYTLVGSVVGPVSKTLSTGIGDVDVSGIYTAETSFVFQGTPFDAKAEFVLGDSITWLATCR